MSWSEFSLYLNALFISLLRVNNEDGLWVTLRKQIESRSIYLIRYLHSICLQKQFLHCMATTFGY